MTKEPKIGDEYFHLFIDEETGDHEWWIYRVRSIQNRKVKKIFSWQNDRVTRYVYAIQINEFTWGKLSTKHGNFGWLDPIADVYRDKWKADQEPYNLFKTKKAALKAELKEYDANNYDNPKIAEKVFRKLQNMLSRA